MRSRKKAPFSKSRKYSKYKITNWSEYNNFLRNRCRIDFMIASDLSIGWYADHREEMKRGRPRRYSDHAILQCLKIRCLFGLKLRQTQGFINWLFEISGLSIRCPDYTTLSKRMKSLDLRYLHGNQDKEFSCISMDSTGIQTYTGNEWLENKHGKQYKRRIWKKLHIVIEDQGMILADSTTEHTIDDRSQIGLLTANVRAKDFLGDRGYDGESTYQLLRKKKIKPVIRPPNSSVKVQSLRDKTERDEAIIYEQNKGYQAWRVKNNYGRRERVENTFFRFKTSFGSKLLSRHDQNMTEEMSIKCHLLNKMFEIGKPISVPVV